MSEAVKSKVNVESNKNVIKLKSGVEIKINSINLDTRCEINDKLFEAQDKPNFSLWVWLIRTTTSLSDNEINNLGTEDIIDASTKIIEHVNKKK